MGFDGKKIKSKLASKQSTQPLWFEALLGVGITVDNYDIFAKKYDEIIEKQFVQNGLNRNKALYKSSDLTSIFYSIGINLIPVLIKELLGIVSSVDIYYHFVPKYYDENSQILNELGVFYEEDIKKCGAAEYIDLITGHFPAICCYSYLKSITTEIAGTRYIIDDCPGLTPSNAVIGVVSNPNTRFLFRGDLVNYVVNAADIFCKYIEETVKSNNLPFDQNLIMNVGLPEDKCTYHFISPRFINAIKPSRKTVLNISHKYPHPIYFFFNMADSAFKSPTNLLENSELYRLALRKASLNGGTVKFYTNEDQQFITGDDFLVTHNEHADKLAEELKRCGCPASIINHSHLKK